MVTDGGNGHAGDGAVLVVSAQAGDFVWRELPRFRVRSRRR